MGKFINENVFDKLMESSLDEITLPRIVRHGTTEQFVDLYTTEDGRYCPPFGVGIWATPSADARSWPKELQPGWRRATVVIDMWRVRPAKMVSNFFYFASLPPGSYKVLRESEKSFERHPVLAASWYDVHLHELEQALMAEPF